jgi:uridine kinase
MNKSQQTSKKILSNIELWEEGSSKLIVVLDGYAGSGKTTIAEYVGLENKDIAVINLDDFIKHWKVRKRLIEKSINKAKIFEYQWYRFKEVEEVIKIFKKKNKGILKINAYDFDKNDFGKVLKLDLSKKVLLIEGIFLLHPEYKLNNIIDKKIYLDADMLKSDKRRVSREKKKFKENFLADDHPDNWVRYFKVAYKNYLNKYHPEKSADLVVKV